jgi:PadR family transcriptional regulator PadR
MVIVHCTYWMLEHVNRRKRGRRVGRAGQVGEHSSYCGSEHVAVSTPPYLPRLPNLDLQYVRSLNTGEMTIPRLSAAERLILDLLVEHDELYGLQLVEQSGGRLKRGTVYVTLGRMLEKGYLGSRQEPLPAGAIGLPRRLYRPTGHAMRVLEAWRLAERMLVEPTPQEA